MKNEMNCYGLHAALMLFEQRPKDIVKVYIEKANVQKCAALLKWCAKNKKAYHVVEAIDLERLTESTHHEGICIVAKTKVQASFDVWLSRAAQHKGPLCCLYLDGVQDPHNIGAIMRTAAHFGVQSILGDEKLLPKLSPSAGRVAKGGAEFVSLVALPKVQSNLAQLKKAGFELAAAHHKTKQSLYQHAFAPKVVIALGAEDVGLRPEIVALANRTFQIPGTGNLESLNVATAAAICMGEYFRSITP